MKLTFLPIFKEKRFKKSIIKKLFLILIRFPQLKKTISSLKLLVLISFCRLMPNGDISIFFLFRGIFCNFFFDNLQVKLIYLILKILFS